MNRKESSPLTGVPGTFFKTVITPRIQAAKKISEPVTDSPVASGKPDQITQELEPDKKQPAPRIPDLALAGMGENPFCQVMRDLGTKILLNIKGDILGI